MAVDICSIELNRRKRIQWKGFEEFKEIHKVDTAGSRSTLIWIIWKRIWTDKRRREEEEERGERKIEEGFRRKLEHDWIRRNK